MDGQPDDPQVPQPLTTAESAEPVAQIAPTFAPPAGAPDAQLLVSPPSPPSAPSPPSPPSPPYVSVVLPPQKPHRPVGLILTITAIVLAGLGAGAYLLLRDDPVAPPATFSLELAIERAQLPVPGVGYDVTNSNGIASTSGHLEHDTASGLTHAVLDMGGMLPVDESVEFIIDSEEGNVYMSSDVFEALGANPETDWILLNMEEISDGALDSCVFSLPGQGNPLELVTQFDDEDSTIDDLGNETIDGDELRHFQVAVDFETFLDSDECIRTTFEASGEDAPDQLVYDVWVTEGNDILRLSLEIEADTQTTSEYVITSTDEEFDIELPDDDEVTPIDELT